MLYRDSLVSVIVISYNHESFLKECLDSVIGQTYTNWELVIADDASKDGSVSVINDWLNDNKLTNIKTNFHKENLGVCKTLNECIKLSQGKYIKFIAADDVMHTQLLEKAVDFFENNEDDYGIVFSNAQFINEKSILENRHILPKDKVVPVGWIREELKETNFVPAPSVVLKKSIYQKIGLYSSDVLIEDYDCWLKASRFFKFHYIDESLVYYRVHSNNVSHQIDFANDSIELLIRNDFQGDFANAINKKIKDFYFLGKINSKVLSSFFHYDYRDKWMAFCIQYKFPYFIFRIVDKFVRS